MSKGDLFPPPTSNFQTFAGFCPLESVLEGRAGGEICGFGTCGEVKLWILNPWIKEVPKVSHSANWACG